MSIVCLQFSPSPVISYALGPNILLCSSLSNTLCSSLSLSNEVSKRSSTIHKIIVLTLYSISVAYMFERQSNLYRLSECLEIAVILEEGA